MLHVQSTGYLMGVKSRSNTREDKGGEMALTYQHNLCCSSAFTNSREVGPYGTILTRYCVQYQKLSRSVNHSNISITPIGVMKIAKDRDTLRHFANNCRETGLWGQRGFKLWIGLMCLCGTEDGLFWHWNHSEFYVPGPGICYCQCVG